uniref:endonuclease/exonuclease/phosphatase family protein n=1 Tax=Gelidibacter sp. TaxID=2018083 RepID=UPI00404B35B3
MNKLSLINKLVFFFNSVAALMLLLSYILPYIEPKKFAILSVLSLGVPVLILVNLLFLLYWLLTVKKQLLLSLIVLILGYSNVISLYKFSASKQIDDTQNISVMSYNVRLFNAFEWLPQKDINNQIEAFIKEKNPDILCLQDYRVDKDISFDGYFKYEKVSGEKVKNGQAIFSKYPIVNSGSVEFPDTFNNAIFVDVVKKNDTIRIYNLHLQSLKIDVNNQEILNEDSEKLVNSVSKTFKIQQDQTELFLEHKRQNPHKTIVCGDFNNTAYSYVYKQIKGDLQDAFVEAGNGFGRTYNFRFFPVRIDFILVDDAFEVNSFKTFDVELSDHYPVMSRVKLK